MASQYDPGYGQAYGVQKGAPTSDEKMWAMLAHLSIFVFAIFGPLIIWMVKKQESSFISDQAKEALNFQLAVLIVYVICIATCILIPIAIVVLIGGWVYGVIGGMEANKGVYYRYPYNIRMIN